MSIFQSTTIATPTFSVETVTATVAAFFLAACLLAMFFLASASGAVFSGEQGGSHSTDGSAHVVTTPAEVN